MSNFTLLLSKDSLKIIKNLNWDLKIAKDSNVTKVWFIKNLIKDR